jgi:hypothetical protein
VIVKGIASSPVRASAFLIVILSALLVIGAPPEVSGATKTDALTAIASAENRIVNCYQATVKAESAGANVTALLAKLDAAGELLSHAQFSYANGDFDSANEFAFQSQVILNGFFGEANLSRENALRDHFLDFMVNIVGSLAGAGLVILGSHFIWRFLKKKYDRAGTLT